MIFRWPTRQPNKKKIYMVVFTPRLKFWGKDGNVENSMNFNNCTYIFVVALTPSLASHRSVIRGQFTEITPR